MADTPAIYQRRRRERLRQQGLIKREIWTPPEYGDLVRLVERALQAHILPVIPAIPAPDARRQRSMSETQLWSVNTLHAALQASPQAKEGEYTIERIEGAEPVMVATMHDFGELPVTISVAGSQIVMSVLLWPVTAIADQPAFERELLLTHKVIPLSTYGITETHDGTLWYEIFGALSSASSLENIVIELETLAENAIDASEHFETHVNRDA